MNRADWLEWRRDGLGGSDVAAILGLSPWSSAFDVWWSKVRSLEDKGSAVKSRGQLLEDAVLQWAKSELGSGLVRGSPLVHPSLSWARGTPDAWTDVDEGLEAKTVRVFEDELWGESGSDVVPLHYRIQCAWYMAITGAKIWRLAAFSTLQEDWRIFELEPDPEVEERLLEVAGRWWSNHVVANEPPELDASSGAAAYLRERYADPSKEILEASSDDLDLLERYLDAKKQRDAAKKDLDELSVQIKSRIGDARGLQGEPGSYRAVWSRFDRSSFQLSALKKDRPDLLEVLDQYTSKAASGRLSVTTRKEPKK